MSRNGSGTYSLPAGNPVVTGTTISSTWANTTLSDIATAITGSIAADGQTPITANLPMGGFKLTGLAAGSVAGDSVRYEQFASPPAIGGTAPNTGAFTTISATGVITSTIATGTAPFTVASTTQVANLNCSTLIGNTWAVPGTIGSTTPNTGAFTTLTANTAAYGTNTTQVATTAFVQTALTGAPLKGYISGCKMSTAGSSATMSIAAGVCTDSTAAYLMTLSAISKTTSSWAVGTAAGGLDTGTIATSTWYYFYVIRRPDTGVVDVVFSTNSTSPTLPTNYTQYRYIGAGKTDGSSNWTKFVQIGREFWWDSPPLDLSTTSSTSAATYTLSVPLGRKMRAYVNVYNAANTYVSDPDTSDLAPSTTVAPLANATQTGTQLIMWTNTSGQLRYRSGTAGAGIKFVTMGWIDLADSQ